jgi:hypothetical protein
LSLALLAAAAGPTTYSFDRDEPGKPPAGFELTTTAGAQAGKWEVRADGDNRVLAQLDDTGPGPRFAMAIAKEGSFKDVSLSVRGKLVWRYKDQDNYYVARSNVLEQNVNFYKVVAGKRKELDGKDNVPIKVGQWHALKVEQKGAAVKVYFDGQKVLDLEDTTFTEAGRVGLWIKADSVTHFDDFTVEELK